MKRNLLLSMLLGCLLTACLPNFLQPDTATPIPVSEADLQATAAVLSQQTLEALPSPTVNPSNTPVITDATKTATLTETATLTTETPTLAMPSMTATGTGPAPTFTLTITPSNTSQVLVTVLPGSIFTPTQTLHPRFYGTLPPNLPYGKIVLINKSKSEVYISLQCTTADGYVTILEYPVEKRVQAKAPAGSYGYVAWVGGRKISGSFHLGRQGEVVLTILKDRIGIK